jgi:hypothetical protein
LKELCRNDDNRVLKIDIFEAQKKGIHKLVGSLELTLKEIMTDDKRVF